MAKTITETLIGVLQNLIDKRPRGGIMIEIPSNNLASWHAAMEFLRCGGIIEYHIVNENNQPYALSLSPIDEQYKLFYVYDNINDEKLREICRKYRIRRTPSKELQMQKLMKRLMSAKAYPSIIDIGPRVPEKVYDIELIFEKDYLVLKSNFSGPIKIPQSGRPAEILSVVAVKGCRGITFGKNAIETKLSKRISDSLPTIFKDNILRHELSRFANIKPREITVYSKGQLRESELQQIKDKVENYYG